ncbi:GTD-binding domain containing protein [uncultured Caudovirales phage]|uniref:GTD-binding domain containing protein n=1 Tax=uncultured Caudovirales phage TaxID=2100421 RepID=A0A6J5L4Q2_9CAUD|nr:GTD-binding domain containing protein [uncultured Caudovirales phage]
MSKVVSFPQARIPLGWAMVDGSRVAVEIDQEWLRALTDLLTRTGGVSGDTSFDQYIPMFFDTPHTDATAREAMTMIDELRNELSSARSEQQQLRSMLEELATQMQSNPITDFRNRIEEIEGRLQ